MWFQAPQWGPLHCPCRSITPGFSGLPELATSEYLGSRAWFLPNKITLFPLHASAGAEAWPNPITSVAEKKESSEVRLSSSSARRRSEPSVKGSIRVLSGRE